MIQLIVQLGQWLERRFPKQVVVAEQDYQQLKSTIERLQNLFTCFDDLKKRIDLIEQNAVHKEPVQELINAMAQMKAEIVSLRAGLGITASANSPESLEAMLNGEFIKHGEHNGSLICTSLLPSFKGS